MCCNPDATTSGDFIDDLREAISRMRKGSDQRSSWSQGVLMDKQLISGWRSQVRLIRDRLSNWNIKSLEAEVVDGWQTLGRVEDVKADYR